MDSQNLPYVEALFEDYLKDPDSVPARWREFFASNNGDGAVTLRPSFKPRSIFNPAAPSATAAASSGAYAAAVLQEKVDRLIRVYRVRGHRLAHVDPLGRPLPRIRELELESLGLREEDLDKPVVCTTIPFPGLDTPRKVLEHLQATYCRSIGVQFMHIDELDVTGWISQRVESTRNHTELSRAEKIRIFRRLNDAVTFEKFLQTKYIGSKSFSLEGAESLIPLLDLAIERGAEQGLDEIVIAMAHRGRLNVLANIMGKTPRQIFAEFEDFETDNEHGDVKYHMGYSNDWVAENGRTVHLGLCFNPSHLEFINPIALGRVRAKQDRVGDTARRRGAALLIHGDAAFIGQGVSQETLNISQLEAYHTGGAIHIVLNNQIGFTTTPEQGRSSTYATDVAKMLQVPVFHVNGEDPEAVAHVVRTAMDFREKFQRDVVIDMYCYRSRGHNEADEPAFTQPLMYKTIRARQDVRDSYLGCLLKSGGITEAEAEQITQHPKAFFDEELLAARRQSRIFRKDQLEIVWHSYIGGDETRADEVNTAVEESMLSGCLKRLGHVPDGFTLHPKLERFAAARLEMAAGDKPLDWGAAESLAYASLAAQGTRVRLTGQDAERGTFTHRHATWHDHENGNTWRPLEHVAEGQAKVFIRNSALSEVAVLGFEYGYSLDSPDVLTLWEAQFGDFVNVAQVIIDQFIVSAEEKWNRLSGLTMLLPHGMEGQGPEHSSARLERFLNLSIDDNIQVCNVTTPAQIFHLLRRQALRRWRKPLIVMSPKSLLRHPQCVSTLPELAQGAFQRILWDDWAEAPTRVLMCSGKVYYDLHAARAEGDRKDVAIVRIEQLYPLKDAQLHELVKRYPNAQPVWVQEEHENMGACVHMRWHWHKAFGSEKGLQWVCRPIAASPATGSSRRHKKEQAELIERALA
ncbi:MAG: 2-oxoglutarate dehydrogenase E1 component [Planctomycetes bacterium]|nr:2-oxoglutarate dehydrogenase E1 component [Planctomycetota bacterium]